MNSASHVPETSSSSRTNQPLNLKEEIDADSVDLVIKVEGEGKEAVPVKLVIKTEDEEKPTMCQCEECGSGGRGRMDRCTRPMDWSQAIKKEEWEGDDEQHSGDMTVKEEGSLRGRVVKAEDDANWAPVRIKREEIEAETGDELGCRKKAKRTEILVKKEVKEEEDELDMAGSLTQRCGSALVDSEIIKFEDDEDVTCPCEDCGMIKREESGEEVKEEVEGANEVVTAHRVEEEAAVEGGESSDDETVVEGGSEAEEEETEDGSTELVQEPIETVFDTAPLEVDPVAGADTEQLRTAKGCKRRPCPQCQKMVTNLTRHLLTHTGERPHICDQCNRSFTQKSHLRTHLKTHTSEKAFSCQHCGKSFGLKEHLKGHLLIHSGEKAFSCQHCGKCFTQKENLTVHLKRHSGEKAHQCDQCPNAFVTSTELTRHRRQHTGQRPYRCHIANCHKVFANQAHLLVHLRQHSGEKRYSCEDCERRFVTSTQLTIHRRQHTGERPFVCHIANCNKAFVNKSNLTTHLRFHSGDKRHQCEDCEMRFVTSSDLTSHRRHKHSTDRPYRCPHSGCNYAAATKCDLKQHLNTRKHRQ